MKAFDKKKNFMDDKVNFGRPISFENAIGSKVILIFLLFSAFNFQAISQPFQEVCPGTTTTFRIERGMNFDWEVYGGVPNSVSARSIDVTWTLGSPLWGVFVRYDLPGGPGGGGSGSEFRQFNVRPKVNTLPVAPAELKASVEGISTSNKICPGNRITLRAVIGDPEPYQFIWEYQVNNGAWQSYTSDMSDVIYHDVPNNATPHTIRFRVYTRHKVCPNLRSAIDIYSQELDIIPPPLPINSAIGIKPVCPGGEGSIVINHSNVFPGNAYKYTVTQYVLGNSPCPSPVENELDPGRELLCGASDPADLQIPNGKYYCKGFIGSFQKTFSSGGPKSFTIPSDGPLTNVNGNEIKFTSGIYEIEVEGDNSGESNRTCMCRYFVQIPEADPTPSIAAPAIVLPSCKGGNDGRATFSIVPRGDYNATHQIRYTLLKGGLPYRAESTNLNASSHLVIDNLSADTYQLSILDICSNDAMTRAFTVGEGSTISLSRTGTDPTCVTNSGGNGRISFTSTAVAGKTYTFELYSSGGSFIMSSPAGQGNNYTFTGLQDLTYYGKVLTTNYCAAESSEIVLSGPSSLQLNAPLYSNPTCSNSSNGSITLTGLSKARGDVNYSYSVKQEGTIIASGANITSLSDRTVSTSLGGGIYTVTITDHCKSDAVREFSGIELTPPPAISLTGVKNIQLSCYEDVASSDITVLSPGPTYTLDIRKQGVSLSGYPKPAQPGGGVTISNLTVDNVNSYIITATENCATPGTPATAAFTVSSNASAPLSARITKHVYANNFNLRCRERHDGELTVHVQGGTAGNASTPRYSVEVLNGSTVLIDNQSHNHNGAGSISTGVPENGGYTFTISGLTHSIGYRIRVKDFNPSPQACKKTFSEDIHGNSLHLLAPPSLSINVPHITNDFDNEVINPADGLPYVQCKGDATINFRAHVSGGSAPYTITLLKNNTVGGLDIFQQNQNLPSGEGNFTGLGAGHYTVTVTDQNSCAFTERPFTLHESPQPLTANLIAYDDYVHGHHTRCYGSTDARITLQGTGGISPYTYRLEGSDGSTRLIEGKTSLQHEYNLLPALHLGNTPITYTAYFIDGLGCAWTPQPPTARNVTLSSPAPLAFSHSVVSPTRDTYEILCQGGSATVHIESSGGAFSHQLIINGTVAQESGATNTFTDFSLSAGSYTLQVRDAEGCETTSQLMVLDEPSIAVTLTPPSVTAPKCIGGTDGRIELSGTGGVMNVAGAEYFFQIKPEGASTFDAEQQAGTRATFLRAANDYTSKNYVVRVTDSHQCYAEHTVEMPVTATPLTLDPTTIKAPSCYGASNGSITVTATHYAGNDLMFTITGGHLGTTTEEFTVSNSNTFTFTNLHGTDISDHSPYSVWVEDANQCTVHAYQYLPAIPLPSPAALILNGTATRPTCYHGTNGSIEVAITGGVAPYHYSFDNVSYHPLPSTTILREGLAANAYSIYVRDSQYDASQATCQSQAQYTVEPGRMITLTGEVTRVFCKGDNTGAIDLSVGVSHLNAGEPFDRNKVALTWTHDDVSSSPMIPTSEDLTGLRSGTYTVRARYDVGTMQCANAKTFTVPEPASALRITTIDTYDASCGEQNNGRAVVNVTGGWPGALRYYKINEGSWKLFSGSSFVLSSLSTGQHEVQISQGPGHRCETLQQFSIKTTTITLQVSHIESPSCPGAGDGSIVLEGTTANLEYALAGGTYQPLGVFTNLSAGTYHFIAQRQDDPSCHSPLVAVTISDPSDCGNGPLKLQVAQTLQTTCLQSTDGIAQVIASGGVPPYRYYWNGTEGTDHAANLAAGEHTVAVHDATAAKTTTTITITSLPVLKAEVFTTKASCATNCDGEASLFISGGSGTYNIVWETDNQTTPHRTGLCTGDYEITIVDTRNTQCTLVQKAAITPQEPISIQVEKKPPTCYGSQDGALQALISGGSNTYTLQWNTGATTEQLTNIGAGDYTITVTDAEFGCTATETVTVQEATPIEVSNTAISPPLCSGGSDGKIVLTVQNVTNSLIQWSNGQVGTMATKLSSGTYSYTITSSNGCQRKGTATVSDKLPLTVTHQIEAQQCYNTCNGSISLAVSGGSEPYQVQWSHGAKGLTVKNLCGGSYTYTVSDRFNCTQVKLLKLITPTPVSLTSEVTSPSCYGRKDGSISLTATGGTGDYHYEWNSGATTSTLTQLSRGGYSVTVRDGHGCAISKNITLSEPGVLHVSSEEMSASRCYGFSEGKIIVKAQGGSQPYAYHWNGIVGTSVKEQLPDGQYSLTVTDKHGCEAKKQYTIKSASPLSLINVHQQSPGCSGEENGLVSVAVEGGTLPYTYQWSTGARSAAIVSLASGTYTVEATDKNGCTVSGSYTLTDPSFMQIMGIPEETVICAGSVVTVIPEGQWQKYLWTGPGAFRSTSSKIEASVHGSYSLTAWDERDCPATKEFSIVVSTSALRTDFLRISEAIAYEPIVFVDISVPVPDETEWIVPEDKDVIVHYRSAGTLEVMFTRTGDFEIGMKARMGSCASSLYKVVSIEEKDMDAETTGRVEQREALKIRVYPNPVSAMLTIEITSPGEEPILLQLISTGDNRNVTSEKVEGKKAYHLNWQLPNIQAGVYQLLYEYKNKLYTKKIVVIQ
jgi:hypothetical protein